MKFEFEIDEKESIEGFLFFFGFIQIAVGLGFFASLLLATIIEPARALPSLSVTVMLFNFGIVMVYMAKRIEED